MEMTLVNRLTTQKDNLILWRTHEKEQEGVSDVCFKFAVRPFQEYLTALAAASGFYPGYQEGNETGGALLNVRGEEELSERFKTLTLTAAMSVSCGWRLAQLAKKRWNKTISRFL